MRRSFLVTAAVAACFVAVSASAGQPYAESLAPTLSLGMQFGGAVQRSETPLHWTAQFDVRSSLVRRDPELLRSLLLPEQPVDLLDRMVGVSLVSVLELGANRKGFDLLHVLDHDVLGTDRLNEDGDWRSGSHNWIWWTAGGIAAAAGVALAAGGGHGGDDNNSGPGNTPNGGGDGCDGVASGGDRPAVVDLDHPSQSDPSCLGGG